MARPTEAERKAKKRAERLAEKKANVEATAGGEQEPIEENTPIEEDITEEPKQPPVARSYAKKRVVEDDDIPSSEEAPKIETIEVSDDDVPTEEYNPLGLPPKAMIRDEIPEQPTQPTANGGNQPINADSGSKDYAQSSSPSSPSGKTEVPKKAIGEAVKRSVAEKSAIAYVGLYCQAKEGIMPELAKINEKKVLKMHRAGEINLNRSIATEQGAITIIEFIRANNSIADTAFKTQPEVKKELTDALTDVLMEQGAVLTPTQRLMFTLGMDIVGASIVAYKLKSSMNEFVKDMREEFEHERSRPRPVATPKTESSEEASPKKEEKPKEPTPTMESVLATAENEGREDDVVEEVEKPKRKSYKKPKA